MIEVTEPQVWALIGIFASAVFGMITLMSTMFIRVVNAGFERVDVKLEHLDRDVQAIARQVFPERE